MTKFRHAFVVVSVGWAATLPLATFVASQPQLIESRPGYALAIATYAIGSLVCHQRPERSFQLFGLAMPVCARCVGIYLGGALVAAVGARRKAPTGGRRIAAALAEAVGHAKGLLLISVTPTAVTLLYEWTAGMTPANWIRAASGCVLGGAVAWIVCTVEAREERKGNVN